MYYEQILVEGRIEGRLWGKIQELQSLLNKAVTSSAELEAKSEEELIRLHEYLEAKLRERLS